MKRILLVLMLLMNLSYADQNVNQLLFELDTIKDKKRFVDIENIEKYLKMGADPNWVSDKYNRRDSILSNYLSNLMLWDKEEQRKDSLKAIQLLFEYGADPSKYTNNNLSYSKGNLLFWPVAYGREGIVEILLKNGVSATSWNKRKIGTEYSPIEYALKDGHKAAADLLIKYGAKMPNNEKILQERFVNIARYGEYKEFKKLIKEGAPINGSSKEGETALTAAISRRISPESWAKVELLLDHNADPNKEGEISFCYGKCSPLHVAVIYTSYSFRDENGWHESSKQILKLLIDKGAFVSKKDRKGKMPLHYAAERDNTYAAELLLSNHSKIMSKDNDGKTPLDYAESGEMIQLLKKYGARE